MGAVAGLADEPAPVTIHVGKVVRPVQRQVIGLNLNYICDNADARNAGRGLETALAQMGVKSLRYPGGEKSDGYLWSVPPFDHPQPTLARVGDGEWPSSDRKWLKEDGKTFVHRPFDFDEFMAICQKLGATPTIVVAYDSIYKPAVPGGTAPTKQQLLDTAVAWVRYANIEKKYGVKYWEIGNESFMSGYNGAATAYDYARDLTEFSKAMKAVDPTILIGANVPEEMSKVGDFDRKARIMMPWWEVVLKHAAPSIDFLALHTYPCYGWKSFDDFAKRVGKVNFVTNEARKALQKWASPADAERIRFAVTEFNAVNYKGFPVTTIGWQNENDLGHALVVFDLIGDWLLDPKIDMAEMWNSRWTHNDTKGKHEIYDAVDADNNLLPTGLSLELWSEFLKDQMNEATSSDPAIRCFASSSKDGRKWSLFLLNPCSKVVDVVVPKGEVDFGVTPLCAIFSGTGPEDAKPQIQNVVAQLQPQGDAGLACSLPPVSVTVIYSE